VQSLPRYATPHPQLINCTLQIATAAPTLLWANPPTSLPQRRKINCSLQTVKITNFGNKRSSADSAGFFDFVKNRLAGYPLSSLSLGEYNSD